MSKHDCYTEFEFRFNKFKTLLDLRRLYSVQVIYCNKNKKYIFDCYYSKKILFLKMK